ncbi:hypothetical protein [Staphylococcus pseudintermedius]|uniref:hypothetical protein n=1 Tax=Staphylococcus pseudintermedius TaxID=283734 RepID=UPI001BDE6857|nr:hypothetical protein [Staphylococcus pseudintermedius]
MKNKIILALASTVLISSVAVTVPNNLNSIKVNQTAEAAKMKYKKGKSTSRIVSVKEQKNEDKATAVAQVLASLGTGGIPGAVGKTGTALLAALGLGSTFKQIDKTYYPIKVVKTHYIPTKKSAGGDMSGANLGYYEYQLYNTKNGKLISKSTVPIQRG